jgi:hypothetical protein
MSIPATGRRRMKQGREKRKGKEGRKEGKDKNG